MNTNISSKFSVLILSVGMYSSTRLIHELKILKYKSYIGLLTCTQKHQSNVDRGVGRGWKR